MPPIWKLQREWDRLGQMARSIVAYPFEGILQVAYDRKFPRQISVTNGDCAAMEKVVIFLIFQPKEILASTLRECRHLIDNGFAPLVISNCPLTEASRAELKQVSWKIAERPNYGYDFGGYRDGVRLLDHWNILPSALLILNDSIWFPLHNKSVVLDKLQAKDTNVAGIFYHEDLVRRSTFSTRKAFLESYLYIFDKEALASEAFKKYWKKYRVSSNKLNAVYRGERALCAAMRAGGLSVEGLIDRRVFLECLSSQSALFLRKTLEYAAYTDTDFAEAGEQLLADYASTPAWSNRAKEHISKVTKKRNLHASFCFASMTLFGIASIKKSQGTFLKKSYGTLHTESRTQYLRALAAGDLPKAFPEIVAEIQARQTAI